MFEWLSNEISNLVHIRVYNLRKRKAVEFKAMEIQEAD
jgi:hypothetical protein